MNLSKVKNSINNLELSAKRKLGSVQLIAVSKVQPNEKIKAVLEQGHRCFGENRVQEALGKWPSFRNNYDNIELHLIGPLQTNKARQAFEIFNVILPIEGLMCIPPIDEEPSLHFSLLKKLQERNDVKSLSMGMSSDFETAITFGATHVRIGSAIFGERIPTP